MLYADRVQETSTTTGTGTLTLAGAVAGYRAFSAAFNTGDLVRYTISGGAEWEVGEGVYSGGTLTRVNVFSSSNAGALVNLSAGTKVVWCDLPAQAVADIALTFAFRTSAVAQ